MKRRLPKIERLLLIVGLSALTIYGTNLGYTRFYQTYAHWAFDQSLNAEPASFGDFVTHLVEGLSEELSGHSVSRDPRKAPVRREADVSAERPHVKDRVHQRETVHQPRYSSSRLSPVGRLQIPAINLSVIVLEGTDGLTLNRAVGHIEGTALPWEFGNTGIAGHRDSFFRGLREISRNDQVLVTTLRGVFRYRVDAIEIVDPTDVGVLKASFQPTLTLVTCYPFYFVGNAPQRFIVKAHLLEQQQIPGVVPARPLPGGVIDI